MGYDRYLMATPCRVAVIGAGPQGLAALKNLLEANEEDVIFEPTLFEARDSVGGIWAPTDDPSIATVLQSTLGNVCIWRNCYGDFPIMDEDIDRNDEAGGAYLGQAGFLRYLERYADRFGLRRYIRFNMRAIGLTRVGEKNHGKWELTLRVEYETVKIEKIFFDKVIVSTGQYSIPSAPKIKGLEKFGGLVIHSKSYKSPSEFKGKKVLLIGLGNTAADISADLVGHAAKIHLSHRHGNYIFPRITNGKPIDMFSNQRMKNIMSAISYIAPVRAQQLASAGAQSISDKALELKPEWNFRPVSRLVLNQPIISDTLIRDLKASSITSHPGVRQIHDDSAIELEDGTRIAADAIVFCTGYRADLSLAPGIEFSTPDPTNPTNPPIPRLYRNLFAPTYPSSLAVLNNWALGTGICEMADLITMAVVQVFKGSYALPPLAQMNAEIDQHRAWCDAVTGQRDILPKLVDEAKFRTWLHDAAGTGVNEMLGYGVQGWLFWARERKFCDMLMGGVESPHLARLFDGRRRKWEGAREAIVKANQEVEGVFNTRGTDKKNDSMVYMHSRPGSEEMQSKP